MTKSRNFSVHFIRTNARLTALFVATYYPADLLAAFRDTRVFAFDWERTIPFVPELYLVYFTVVCLPGILIFYFNATDQTERWASDMSLTMLLGATVFVLFPTAQFQDTPVLTQRTLQDAIVLMTGRHNLFPSLHVALSTVIVQHAVHREDRSLARAALWLWLVALVASTVLTRQHNIADALGGALLGWAVTHFRKFRSGHGINGAHSHD